MEASKQGREVEKVSPPQERVRGSDLLERHSPGQTESPTWKPETTGPDPWGEVLSPLLMLVSESNSNAPCLGQVLLEAD